MNSDLYKIRASLAWSRWCDADVAYDVIHEAPRKVLIMNLVKNGIVPLFKNKGYVFSCDTRRIAECVARYIYFGKVSHEAFNWDYRAEDYYHYYHVLDDDTWDEFWDVNGKWADVEDVTVREGIRSCVWTLLDLYKSPVTEEVDDMLGLNDEENMPASREDSRDPYLIDSANGYFSAI